jgi:hypothetical protein
MDRQFNGEDVSRAFQYMRRRAEVISGLIEGHRTAFGNVPEPSIDAICLTMVCLAALAKFRYQGEINARQYASQFRHLLRDYGAPLFEDRISIPELARSDPFGSLPSRAIQDLVQAFPEAPPASKHDLERDPPVEAASSRIRAAGFTVKAEDLERFTYSSIIYRKYRNPVIHALNIADGNEPRNMWFGRPGLFYANSLGYARGAACLISVRSLGVTDEYLLALMTQIVQDLEKWCMSEERNIFDLNPPR